MRRDATVTAAGWYSESVRALIPALAFALLLAACGDGSPGSRYTPPAGDPSAFITLRTTSDDGLAFVGVDDDIDGARNPTLEVAAGEIVEITLENGDGVEHDISIPDLEATSARVSTQGAQTTLVFRAEERGELKYICTVPGHRQAGMEGAVLVR